MTEPSLLSVVALLEDVPAEGVLRGHVGTIVESLGPGAWLVEFSDRNGVGYAMLPLKTEQFLVLRHEPVAAA